jgi:hypothetical protein
MRRTIFLALLATLLIVPAARAASSAEIWADCQKDSVLQGHYTTAELRKARSTLPTDIDEYSDCRDVLSRAISGGTSSSGSGNGGGGGGGGGGSSSGGGTSSGAGSRAGSGATADSGPPPAPVTPTTPQDQAALTEAASTGGKPVDLNGQAVLPGGASQLSADVGRNTLPTTLVFVLLLLAAAALAAATPRIRHRVLTHRRT